jgi:hypothetical protein
VNPEVVAFHVSPSVIVKVALAALEDRRAFEGERKLDLVRDVDVVLAGSFAVPKHPIAVIYAVHKIRAPWTGPRIATHFVFGGGWHSISARGSHGIGPFLVRGQQRQDEASLLMHGNGRRVHLPFFGLACMKKKTRSDNAVF